MGFLLFMSLILSTNLLFTGQILMVDSTNGSRVEMLLVLKLYKKLSLTFMRDNKFRCCQ